MSVLVLPGNEKLTDALIAEVLTPDVVRVTLAPGYLYAPGFAPVWNALQTSPAQEIRLLTGNTAGLMTVEQRFVAAAEAPPETHLRPELDFAASARAERDRVRDEVARALRANLNRMNKTTEEATFLLSIARAIAANRVRIRVYAEGRLHTKAAVIESASRRAAFVGTTNVSLPVAANRTQINLRISEPVAATEVSDWLNALWNDSQDFSRPFFDEISAFVAQILD